VFVQAKFLSVVKAFAALATVAPATLAALAAPAHALTLSDIVYQDQLVPLVGTQTEIVDGSSNGLQRWQGNLGMDFTVNSPIQIGALGVFDNGQRSELSGTTGNGILVGIFSLTTGQLVSPSVLFTASSTVAQIGADAFQSVTPFSLTTGSYSIVTLNDPNYNQGFFGGPNIYQTLNPLGGAISFIGSGRYDGNNTTLELPGGIDGGPANRYDAGTFAVTPLPSTWTMFALGLIALGMFGYRATKENSVTHVAA
jgi:hypothetical protein